VIELLRFVLAILVSPFRSKARLEAEIATLRQQLIAFGDPQVPCLDLRGLSFEALEFRALSRSRMANSSPDSGLHAKRTDLP